MLRGVVEGFYGREWRWQDRRSYAGFLRDIGLNAYIYCPKGDPFLRKRWREEWPAETAAELACTAGEFRAQGLSWGVGLSPFALYQDYSPAARRALRQRVTRLRDLGGNILAILFDDMPGDAPDLAARQAEIVADVQAWSDVEHLLVCPTYYSHDPVLEQHFGQRPPGYWRDLGHALGEGVGVFWTGNRVCSDAIAGDDLASISAELGRAPVLWDNYPVNDGARASRFLHIEPLPNRSPDLAQAAAGHFCNPMNQAWLSRYPLTGLATLYGAQPMTLADIFPPELAALLGRDAEVFQQRGLDQLDAGDVEALCRDYGRLDHPAAAEVVAWLRGEYAFDPACLTG